MQLFIPSGGAATTRLQLPTARAATGGNDRNIARRIHRHSPPKWHFRTGLNVPASPPQVVILENIIKNRKNFWMDFN
jgi:hypothetical protein